MKYGAILLTCLAVVFGAVLAWSVRDENPHEFEGMCETCHLTQPVEGQVGLFVKGIDVLCRECHEVSTKNSHPTQVFPSMSVPDAFSLNWQGMMSCATCHDPHLEQVGGNEYLLRSEARGAEFCRLCHSEFSAPYAEHKSLAAMVHHKSWTPPDPSTLNENLDKVSLECLSCHDGTVQESVNYRTAGSNALTYQDRYFTHPIGVDYAEAARENMELRSLDDLSPYISLIEGRVGCASCHSIFSEESTLLVFDNRGSALCLECHVK